MRNRSSLKVVIRFSLLLAFCCVLVPASGCMTWTAHMIRVIYGNEVKPEFEGLKDQKVAILVSNERGICGDEVCIRLASLMQTGIGNDLKKLNIVRQESIDNWVRDNPSGDDAVSEIGKGVQADMVIHVDMQKLTLLDGPTLYRGKSELSVEVLDVKQDKIIFRKTLPEFTYPQSAAISTTEMDKAKFQRLYLNMVAERLNRIFIHSPMGSDVAGDARILQY